MDKAQVVLKVLTAEDCEQVRLWRNESLVALRTPYFLTEEAQHDFYTNVICNRNVRARFWGIWTDEFIGMCGLENIEWENRRAEISLILSPNCQRKGFGMQTMQLLLKQGFLYMNLDNIWGECYLSNPAIHFWEKIIQKYNSYSTRFINTKYWNGEYSDSLFFNIKRSDFTNESFVSMQCQYSSGNY
jgi:diamine N-acetyltransferase